MNLYNKIRSLDYVKLITMFFIFLIVSLVLSSFAGCGSNENSSNSTSTEYIPHIAVNEIVAKDANSGNDWIELYINASEAVNLGEYSLIDDDEDGEAQALPDITVNPGEFVIIYAADEDPGDGSYYVPFKLGSDDSVSLLHNGEVIHSLDWEDGDAASGYSYGLLTDGTGDAQKLLPSIGTNNFGVFAADKVVKVELELADSAWQAILDDPTAEEYQEANITFDGYTVNTAAVRTKGNSSLTSVANSTSERYSLKVDLNYYVDGQDLVGNQKLNLNNGHNDPSFMREYLAYALMRGMGLPAPRTAFADLYINGDHFGLYTVVEQVDDEFVENNFSVDDGDLYKPDGTGSDLVYISDDFSDYDGIELKTNEDTSDYSAFISFINELNFGSDYDSVLDSEAFLKYLAVSTILTNLDSYQGALAHNYYLYEQDGIFTVIPWDFNEAFGTFCMSGCSDDELLNFLIDEPTSSTLSDRPLIDKILSKSANVAAYHEYLEECISGPFALASMETKISAAADLIRDYVYNDPTKFFTTDEFESAISTSSNVDGTFGLLYFIEQRISNVSGQLNGSSSSSGDGSGSCSGTTSGPGGGGGPPF
ncbi:MAG: cellulosomal protein [bacterium]|nr:cellulosomal protein [bacterium]